MSFSVVQSGDMGSFNQNSADYIESVRASGSRRRRRDTAVVKSMADSLNGDDDRIRRVTDEDSPAEGKEVNPIQTIAHMSMEEANLDNGVASAFPESVKPKVPSAVENEVFSEDREFVLEEIELRKERLNSKRKRESVAAEIRSFGMSREGMVGTGLTKPNSTFGEACLMVPNESGGNLPYALGAEEGGWDDSGYLGMKKKSGNGGTTRRSFSPPRGRSGVRTCTNCNKTGHDRRNCNKPRLDSNGEVIVSQRRCTRCGSLRHDRRTCNISAEEVRGARSKHWCRVFFV